MRKPCDAVSLCTLGSQSRECNDPFSSIICPNIVEPDFNSLEESFNTMPDLAQKPVDTLKQSMCSELSWCSTRLGNSLPLQYEDRDSNNFLHGRSSNSSLQGEDASAALQHRGLRRRASSRGGRRNYEPQKPPCKLSVVLDLLPWTAVVFWVAAALVGGRW